MDAMDEGDGRLASPAASPATPTPQFTPRPSQGRFELSKANRSEGWSECWTGVVGHAVHIFTSPGGSKYKGEREAKEALRGCDTTPIAISLPDALPVQRGGWLRLQSLILARGCSTS